MRFMHRIALNLDDPADRAELAAFGLDLWMQPPLSLVIFDIDETDARWSDVEAWLQGRDHGDTVTTKFTKKELDSAAWLTIRALLYHGYPEPHDDDGYLELTYDLSDYCEECGIGKRQKAPFRMRGEPKWGKRGLIQMYWVYDELFVTPEVCETVFAPFGIGRREVLSRGGKELRTVVQLVIEGAADVETTDLVPERCSVCGRTKYAPHVHGFFPPLAGPPPTALAKTRQWFGSGGQAFQELLVSRELRQALLAAGVKGAGFTPLKG